MSSWVSLTSWIEGVFLTFVGHPSHDVVTIKIPYDRVDILLQPSNPFFPVGLIKSGSDVITRLAETSIRQ